MLEERPHQDGPATDLSQLPGHTLIELFTLLERTPGIAGALRVAPDQFVGVEVRGIAGQIMQGQFAIEFRDITLVQNSLDVGSSKGGGCR